MTKITGQLLIPLLSVMTALLFSALFIAMIGEDPVMICSKMVRSTIGSSYGTGHVLFRMTTLVLVALAVAIPFKVRLFNIGAEGQLLMGAFAAAMTGSIIGETLSSTVAIALCILSAMAAGCAWALLAGVLRVQFGVNEVIGTIMLNFIAQGITGYLLTWHFALPSTVHTAPISNAAIIPTIESLTGWFAKSPANLSLLLSLALPLLFYALLFKTRFGYEMRAAGLQPEAARYGGINAKRHTLMAMGTGGAIAGLGAANIVLGYKHYYESGMTGGIGFTGIAVALLAGAHPVWILLSALFFGFLEYGGLSVNAWVPKDIFMIIEAMTILLVITFSSLGKQLNKR
ncbi:MAG: ABC transporter permease [Chlorobiaceae bacterium]|nr:ABC transporter permease [Chlorobiaceae bacterium]